MATITIRNVPDEWIDHIKRLAEQKGISMEQENALLRVENQHEPAIAALETWLENLAE